MKREGHLSAPWNISVANMFADWIANGKYLNKIEELSEHERRSCTRFLGNIDRGQRGKETSP
jgi:hypothetical protein